MSFPTTLYLYKADGSQTKHSNGAAVTRKRVLFSRDAYRDIFNAAQIGGSLVSSDNVGGISAPKVGDGALTTGLYSTLVPSTITNVESFSLSDEVSHYAWRVKEYVRWLVEVWDSAVVGHAMTMTVDTTSGSATITVPDGTLLTPGQAISGTGIPTGAKVLEILPITDGIPSRTSVKLTHKCTASAAVEATLTGSNRIGWCFEDELMDAGSEISFPV